MFIFQRCFADSASTAAMSFFAVSRLIGVPYGISNGMPSAVPPAEGDAAGAAGAAGACANACEATNMIPTAIDDTSTILLIEILLTRVDLAESDRRSIIGCDRATLRACSRRRR